MLTFTQEILVSMCVCVCVYDQYENFSKRLSLTLLFLNMYVIYHLKLFLAYLAL